MKSSTIAPQTPAEARPSRARGRPSRGQRTTQQTRSTILNASLTFFAERGFDAASMRDIAAAGGVEHSLLRYHFGDKSALWREAVSLMIDRLDVEIAGCWRQSEGAPMVKRFKQFLRAHVRYCAAHPEHARVVV